MIIPFPSPIDDSNPAENTFITYKLTLDCYQELLKRHSSYHFFFWKIAGINFIFFTVAFFLSHKGIISNPYIMLLFTGIGCLIAFALNIRKDSDYVIRIAKCIKKRVSIEKTQNHGGRLFQVYDKNKNFYYLGHLLNRLIPFLFIGLSTAITGVVLSMQFGIWLATLLGLFSSLFLFSIAWYYIHVTRKSLLEDRL